MKKPQKFVLKGQAARRSAGGSHVDYVALELADLHLDGKSVALFSGISKSTEFTAEAAHRAFAGLKRR